jgi:signal transduction histidine kinase
MEDKKPPIQMNDLDNNHNQTFPPKRSWGIEILKRIPGNLQVKVSILILLPVILILTLATAIDYRRNRESHLNILSLQAAQTGQVIEEALQRDMFISDFEAIQNTVDVISRNQSVRSLFIFDIAGRIVFAPSGYDGLQNLENDDAGCQICHRMSPDERPSGVVVTTESGQSVFRSMHPIENRPECTECHDPQDRLIGLLLTDQSIEPVNEALTQALRDNIFLWIGAVLATAVLSNIAVYQFIVQRLRELAAAMESFGSGKHHQPLQEEPKDEIGRLSTVFNTMSGRIMKREKENTNLTAALDTRIAERGILLKRLIHTQEEERKRLAREIHDEVGQSLSSIALNIELTQRSLEDQASQAIEHLRQASAMVSETTDHMYDLILGLRPSALDDLGLIPAIKVQIQRTLEPAEISYELQTSDLPKRLPPQLETVLFRLFQEAITNVLRHANATHVILSIEKKHNIVVGKIIDDGIGFDPELTVVSKPDEGGLGLLGMRERVDQFNGQIEIQSNPGTGTSIFIYIPFEDEPDA